MTKKFLNWREKRDYFFENKGENQYSALKVDFRPLARWEDGAFNSIGRMLGDIAQAIKDEIDESWSEESPSKPGTPPAIVTGYLKNSGQVLGRQSGNFTRMEDATLVQVIYTAPYADALEHGVPGRMAARPFFERAVNKVMRNVKGGVNYGGVQTYWK